MMVWNGQSRPVLADLLAKPRDQLTGGDITFIAWAAFGEWCSEQSFDDDEPDWPARAEAYSQACVEGWLPSWERPASTP